MIALQHAEAPSLQDAAPPQTFNCLANLQEIASTLRTDSLPASFRLTSRYPMELGPVRTIEFFEQAWTPGIEDKSLKKLHILLT